MNERCRRPSRRRDASARNAARSSTRPRARWRSRATLVDAAPRMLEAICEALGWEYGAFWEVDRARNVLRCVGTWQPPSLPFEEFAAATPGIDVSRPASACPDASGPPAEPAWIPDVTRDANFPRAAVAERAGLHAAFGAADPAGPERARRDGVLQPRHPRAHAGPAGDDDDRRQPDRAVRRAQVGGRGARPVLHAVARPVLRRHLRRLFRPRQSRMADACSGFSEAELRASPFMDFVHPDDRAATIDAMSALHDRRAASSISRTGIARSDGSYKWLQWTSAPFADAGPRLRGRARRHRSQGSEALRVRARWSGQLEQEQNAALASSSRSSRSRASAPSRRRWPRASSWRT